MTRTRLPVDSRRAQLLELGRSVFSHQSYDALTTDEIATQAGISKGLLFHYFGSKRGFYEDCLVSVAKALLDATEPDYSLPLEASLSDSISRFLSYVDQNPAAYRALLRGGVGSDDSISAVVEDVRWTMVARVLCLLGQEKPSPSLRLQLYGGIGFAECVALNWVDQRDVELAEIHQLILNTIMGLAQ